MHDPIHKIREELSEAFGYRFVYVSMSLAFRIWKDHDERNYERGLKMALVVLFMACCHKQTREHLETAYQCFLDDDLEEEFKQALFDLGILSPKSSSAD